MLNHSQLHLSRTLSSSLVNISYTHSSTQLLIQQMFIGWLLSAKEPEVFFSTLGAMEFITGITIMSHKAIAKYSKSELVMGQAG